MVEILKPNINVVEITKPLIFLAGPTTDGPKWHSEAIEILSRQNMDLLIAVPSKKIEEEIMETKGEIKNVSIIKATGLEFPKQRLWELHYLNRCQEKGAVLFWLPGPINHSEKIYSAMTRLELGEQIIKLYYDESNIFCVGTDGNFPEFSTIRQDLKELARIYSDEDETKEDKKQKRNGTIHSTLEETCNAAIEIVLRRAVYN